MPTTTDKLGPRELATVRLLARGMQTADIAANLGVKPTSVRSYIACIAKKWGTRDRAEIVQFARRRGLIPDQHTERSAP